MNCWLQVVSRGTYTSTVLPFLQSSANAKESEILNTHNNKNINILFVLMLCSKSWEDHKHHQHSHSFNAEIKGTISTTNFWYNMCSVPELFNY